MRMRVLYERHATKNLERMSQTVADRIVSKISWYATQDDPLRFAKKLKTPFEDLYCFKIGDYIAIFEMDSKGNILLLVILKI